MKIFRYELGQIKDNMLDSFVRTQESTRIMKYEGKSVIIENFYYFNEWDNFKLRKKVVELRNIVENGGDLLVAYDEECSAVVGFATLNGEFEEDDFCTVEMKYLHVSNPYRGKGIGKRLFSQIKILARHRGARKIIIGTIPAIETQNFYEKIGCRINYKLNQRMLDEEPEEIQRISEVFPNVILASKSPRRQELLARIFTNFDIMVGHEEDIEKCKAEDYVMKLALGKAKSIIDEKEYIDSLIIGSDTVVVIDDEILGKPKTKNEAVEMLSRLSGRSHYVYTGVAFVYINNERGKVDFENIFYERTEVKFSEMSICEIMDLIEKENVMDKAGAYSIQGIAGKFIESIDGDYYNVMGLPLNKVYKMFKKELF